MITYSPSVNHQKDIRAAVGIAPANYDIYVPPKTHEVCTFDGGHTNIANDPGTNQNWIPQESWKLFKQF